MEPSQLVWLSLFAEMQRWRYWDVAACSMFFYDYCLTFWMEKELIWTAEWNVIKILYLAQRYTPFVDTLVLTTYRQFADIVPLKTCLHVFYSGVVITMFGVISCQALLATCIWALWRQSKRIGFLLILSFLSLWVPACATLYYFSASMRFFDTSADNNPITRGCVVSSAKVGLYYKWTWILRFIWNIMSVVLVAIPAIKDSRSQTFSQTSLVRVIYRDGIYYYVFLLVVSILSITGSISKSPKLRNSTSSFIRLLQPTLASRIVLHMRARAKKEVESARGSESSMIFTSMPAASLQRTDITGESIELHEIPQGEV